MTKSIDARNSIMYRSPELIKATAAYQKHVAELKQEIKEKSQPVITG